MRIIQKMYGLDGKLSRSNSAILKSLLERPTLPVWQKAKNMIICDQPLINLNAAVRAVSHGKLAVAELPDTFTLYRAFKYSIEKRKRFYHKMEVCDTES